MRYRVRATFTIYQLVDPRDNLPRYVGCTQELPQRYSQHLTGDSSSEAKNTWVEELKALGFVPIIQELEQIEGTTTAAAQREIYWINYLLRQGMPLLNVRDVDLKKDKTITVYLTSEQIDKLSNLQHTLGEQGLKINRNEIVRLLIDQCDIDSLVDLVRLAEQRTRRAK